MEAIIVALIGAFTTIVVALIGLVNRNARKAAQDARKAAQSAASVSNGFTHHVMDEFEASKQRDAELSQKFDDHLAWSREETERLWAAVIRSRSDHP